MRNLWIFLSKYSAFFFFIIFFVCSVTMVVKNNSYQHATFINSSATVVGEAYARINGYKSYLNLKEKADLLAAENAALRQQLKTSFYYDSVTQRTVKDTLTKQQYTYIVARVVNNSVNQKDNFLTIDRGTRHGIGKDMGVVTANGVVGIIRNVNERYATISSLLNSETHVSATVAGTNAFGSLIWGIGNSDPTIAILQDIPNHIIVKPGQKVVTTSQSTLFPAGHPIGTVKRINRNSGGSFWDIEVKLSTNFATLEYVYVVNNLFAAEQKQLEAENNKVK
ncbi:rod shape-determining protein MreC [Hufsiella ginkgonis]|uniref:Cell shape-determining protein MreC n=1 Tax=Hufsiella ginkgonis TaxID=2695274 RepID=A0A7K1XVQ3_9SPHI|nr:rod shape-determining protein MreC [Hufsiella ginkgonis]MXV14596.1 rod shape-determining protein MreC [Hufsiella ginkgonis]